MNEGESFFRAERIMRVAGAKVIFWGAVSGIVLKLFIFDVFRVSGSSMERSVSAGDFVLVNNIAYGLVIPFCGRFFFRWSKPSKGEAVVFLKDGKTVMKRVAMTEGEKLVFVSRGEENFLVTKGKEIPLSRAQYEALSTFREVPSGTVFVLGDNEKYSRDSRDYGFVYIKNITGKVQGV